MSGKNARSWTNPTAGVFCWSQDVCYGVCVRQQEGQPLLDVGLKRAARLGVQETIPVFNAEVSEMIGEKNQQLLLGLANVPRRLRNDVLLEVATELIMPVIRAELTADANVPPETDLDFFAYLLSLGELIAFDYGSLRDC